jgi:hypothetical protein
LPISSKASSSRTPRGAATVRCRQFTSLPSSS